MTRDKDFIEDLARYPPLPFLREHSIWPIYVYRYGRRLLKRKPSMLRSIQFQWFWLMFRVVETATGISLSPDSQIGPGLRIFHFGNIFVHSNAILGRNCTLRQGVTIGSIADNGAPTVGDDVDFGAYTQALGAIHIGDRATLGAMALVITDVPADATAVGVPARIIANQGTFASATAAMVEKDQVSRPPISPEEARIDG